MVSLSIAAFWLLLGWLAALLCMALPLSLLPPAAPAQHRLWARVLACWLGFWAVVLGPLSFCVAHAVSWPSPIVGFSLLSESSHLAFGAS